MSLKKTSRMGPPRHRYGPDTELVVINKEWVLWAEDRIAELSVALSVHQQTLEIIRGKSSPIEEFEDVLSR